MKRVTGIGGIFFKAGEPAGGTTVWSISAAGLMVSGEDQTNVAQTRMPRPANT
jgi:hypothetical protein